MEISMLVVGAVIVALPTLLMWAFNRGDLADSRGRRINRKWRALR